jgi:carbon storage regulator
MLILTRRIDQGIVISGNIIVKVLGVERDRVKIGIQAPADIPVLRQELLEREDYRGAADQPAEAQYCLSPPIGYSAMQQGTHDYRKGVGQSEAEYKIGRSL